MLDDVTILVESHGGDAALGKKLPVIRFRQILLNGRGDLRIEHRALFNAEFAQFQLAGQRGLDPPTCRRLLTRYLASYPRPVVELLLGRTALPRTLGGSTVHEVGRDAGHPISVSS